MLFVINLTFWSTKWRVYIAVGGVFGAGEKFFEKNGGLTLT